jgi:poly(A) polymerase
MKELMVMQLRLNRTRGKRVLGLLGQGRFRAAYDFLCLRARVGDADPALAEFWTRLQEMDEAERAAEVGAGRRPKGESPPAAPAAPAAAGDEGTSRPRRRRRRPRRRKPGGGAG